MSITRIGLMPRTLLACALAVSAGSAVGSGGAFCDYDSATYAKLNPRDFAGCVKLRTKGTAAVDSPTVRSLTNQSVFATMCPVQIGVPEEPHHTDCSKVAAEALKADDLVRIDEWGPDKLELVILRDGVSVFHPDQPRVFLKPATVTLDKQVHTIGYFADALVYATSARPGKSVPASYYVYLADTLQNDNPIRWYQIEVFESSPKCRAEIPGHPAAGTEIVACGSDVTNIPIRLRKQKGVMQSPLGGGGEPPRDPPG